VAWGVRAAPSDDSEQHAPVALACQNQNHMEEDGIEPQTAAIGAGHGRDCRSSPRLEFFPGYATGYIGGQMGQARWAGTGTARKSTTLARPGPTVVPCLGLYVGPQCRHGHGTIYGPARKRPSKAIYLSTAHGP
jgi:hypothetical protein